MNAFLPYILPLIGLLFIILGVAFRWRARVADITPMTSATRRRLGLIYLVAGALLTALGIMRF